MNMEIYRNFIKIVTIGTISGASRELHIAQPALSNQVKALEKEYGAQLLERGARHVSLTNAGKILFDQAKRMSLLEEQAQKDIRASVRGTRGTLRLGITPSYPDLKRANLILNFSKAYPDVDFDIYERNSNYLLEDLSKGRIEIAIIRTSSTLQPQFATPVLTEEHLMAAYKSQNHWLSPKLDVVPLTALEGVPLSISRGFRKKIIDSCLYAGFTPIIHSISSSRYLPLLWADQGMAVGIFIGSAPSSAPPDMVFPGLCCRPLAGKDLDAKQTITIIKDRPLSAVAQAFLQFAKKNEP
ncbi:MAG: LysR family transcriptional regulator [Megasphaera sp.]|jgi:DNA-binding transcriptional LysR family regulator|nr:LysR family transcriptional regulator [Megasphaera sp.]MCH4188567.1 LysR family transcriptional regulator [Megasphaera sp.]MCH4218454.1 LysR family transcriptional regulator [Megasphaera sp.]